jgi:hypothetical protein
MKPGEWYKEFGSGATVTFYHILSVEEDVDVTIYSFDAIRKRVVSEKNIHIDSKEWMEHEIRNDFHKIPRNTVPFIMPF